MTTEEDPTNEPSEDKPERGRVMQSLTALCVRYVERVMPDPYRWS
jgi:short-chain fatty acids transporter